LPETVTVLETFTDATFSNSLVISGDSTNVKWVDGPEYAVVTV